MNCVVGFFYIWSYKGVSKLTYLGCKIGLSFSTKSAPNSRLISKNSCQKAIAFHLPNPPIFGTKYTHICPQILPSHPQILLFFCQKFPNKISSPPSISLFLQILNHTHTHSLNITLPSLSTHTHPSCQLWSLLWPAVE